MSENGGIESLNNLLSGMQMETNHGGLTSRLENIEGRKGSDREADEMNIQEHFCIFLFAKLLKH